MNLREQLLDPVLAFLGTAHPAALLVGLALLPLVGFPASPLLVAAGVRLGIPLGLALSMAGLLLNNAASYWLARRWLRGWLTAFLSRRGHAIPQLDRSEELRFLVLFRATPGVPLFLQSYLLGLSGVGFRQYLLVSMAFQTLYAAGFVCLGNALTHSAIWKGLIAILLLVAVGSGIGLLRSRLNRTRGAAAGLPEPPG